MTEGDTPMPDTPMPDNITQNSNDHPVPSTTDLPNIDHSIQLPDLQQELQIDNSLQNTEKEESNDNIESNDNQDPLLLKEQLKWFAQFIKNMKKKKDAFIFLNPVDPVALNIPTYFTVIQNPMDISTIEKKLKTYKSIKEAQADVDLMLENCFAFNGPVSPVTLMAKNLQSWYLKEFEKCPKALKPQPKKKEARDSIGQSSKERLFQGRRKEKIVFKKRECWFEVL